MKKSENPKVHFPKIIIKEGKVPQILIDGKELPLDDVLGYKIEHRGGGVPILSIDFCAMNLELSGIVVPKLPDILEGYYVSNMQDIDNSEDA